jgi:2-aminobenzoate-CoA ligase
MSRRTAHRDTFVLDRLPPPEQWPEFLFARTEYRYPAQLNAAAELVDTAVARGSGARPALRVLTGGREIVCSYAQLAAQVDRIAHVLVEDLGLVPGNRVLLRGPNTPMMAACWLAVLKAGLVAVPTMPLLRARELKAIIDKAQVGVALCDVRLRDELALNRDPAHEHHAPTLREVLHFQTDDADSVESRARAKPAAFTAVATRADDPALIAFTSGTTGQPKGTVHFHRDVLVMSDAFPRHVLHPAPHDVFCGTPPLAFTFGLGGLLTMPLRAGASTLLIERPAPDTLLDAMRTGKATIVFTAPTMYRQMALLLKEGKAAPVPSLVKSVSAGEALPDATRRLWRDATGIEMIDGIGATEMIHIFISSAGRDVRPGAVGKPVPGYVCAVVDESMREVPPGTIGKLAVKGPSGCRYLDDPRQSNYVRDGWNLPGDTFVMDADGYFIYQARSDDMIVSAGYNIAGPEVEAALLLHPAVAECGVVAAPDAERGHIVKAYVVLKPGTPGDDTLRHSLQEFVKQQIAPYKYPRALEFVQALPRTETGKLQRFRLRELAQREAT